MCIRQGRKKELSANGKITFTITLKNTGNCDGAEVVQLYVGQQKPKIKRPLKELKAFEKVSLKAGETKEVSFSIDSSSISYYDEATHAWKIDNGKYTVYIGTSSDTATNIATFRYSE